MKSLGYPDNDYENNVESKWNLIVETGKVIHLKFTFFEIESGGNYAGASCYDYLKIGDKDGTTLMGETCGNTELPPEITSNTNEIIFEFVSDIWTNERGYHVNWEAVDPPSGRRKRQALDTSVQREVECVNWLEDTAAYWKYDLEIPASCYSKCSGGWTCDIVTMVRN